MVYRGQGPWLPKRQPKLVGDRHVSSKYRLYVTPISRARDQNSFRDGRCWPISEATAAGRGVWLLRGIPVAVLAQLTVDGCDNLTQAGNPSLRSQGSAALRAHG
jgi:hypothetical protein